MTKQKPVPLPDVKDIMFYSLGFALGFLTPSFLFNMIKSLFGNSLVRSWVSGKAELIGKAKSAINMDADVPSFLFFMVFGLIILVALKKGAGIIYKLGFGFLIGMGLRFAFLTIGIKIPYVGNPANQTINQTNSTL